MLTSTPRTPLPGGLVYLDETASFQRSVEGVKRWPKAGAAKA
jgi:hypothetical protein